MSFGKLVKLGALALIAAGPAMADEGGDCIATSYDFITRTMGHITYTLLRPTTTYDPYPDFVEAAADITITVTATAVETVVSTSVEVLTVVTTTTLSSLPSWTPLTSPIPQLPTGVEKRDVTTVTVDGGYGTLSASTGVTETAMGGGGPSTTTVSATSTTKVTGTYSLTYPSGLSTATAMSVTTMPAATLATTPAPTTASSSGVTETTANSISVSLSSTSTGGTFVTMPTSSSTVSSVSTQSSLAVPAESETNPAPSKPTTTVVSGSSRGVPILAFVALMSVFAI
ncbi:hypothetical protein SCUCBS95973_003439 [Sporothrix curviconia]|uniref:Uncharacterized protein n=1 Tax=Sporothrix curviconia TaxID=1260050 RepID=A0ABP0BF92_9PEZI